MITQVINEVNFKIQKSPTAKTKVIHMDQIKLCECDPPRESWLVQRHKEPEVTGDTSEGSDRQPEEAATLNTQGSDLVNEQNIDITDENSFDNVDNVLHVPGCTQVDEVTNSKDLKEDTGLRRSRRPHKPMQRLDL